MIDDFERRVRVRLRAADLPVAPESLRLRVQAVASNAPSFRDGVADLVRQGRFLAPLAAILVISALAISGGSGPRPPTSSASGSPLPAGPAHASLTVASAVHEWPCSPGGCEYQVELVGPGGPWLARSRLGQIGIAPLSPQLPDLLATGTYSIRTEIHVIGDAIYPGESGPRDLGISATCSSDFQVDDATRVVAVALDFWTDRCSAGTVTTADQVSLATLSVIPTVRGECGGDAGGCDYRLALTGPGGSWLSTTQTVKPADQLEIGPDLPSALPPGSYRLEASAFRMSEEPFPGVGHQSELAVAAQCETSFEITTETDVADVQVLFDGESCTANSSTRLLDRQVVDFDVDVRVYDGCRSIGGCKYVVELTSPTARWVADVLLDGPDNEAIGPGLPNGLEAGTYTVVARILFMSDEILNGVRSSFGTES